MTDATLPPSSPTATHVVELGTAFGAQETAETFASGVYEALVPQLGVTAAAPADTGETGPQARKKRATATKAATNARTLSTATSLPHGEPTKGPWDRTVGPCRLTAPAQPGGRTVVAKEATVPARRRWGACAPPARRP